MEMDEFLKEDNDDENLEEEEEEENLEEEEKKEKKKRRRRRIILLIFFLLFVAAVIFIFLCFKPPKPGDIPSNITFGTTENEKSFNIKYISDRIDFLKSFNFLKQSLDYQIITESKNSWMSILAKSGSIDGIHETEKSISIKIDRSKLRIGNNKGRVVIQTNGGDKTINVTVSREDDVITMIEVPSNAVFMIGSESTIRWEATTGVSDSVNVYLYLNDCVIKNIAKNYNYRSDNTSPGELKWTLDKSLLPGGEGYTIKVEDAKNHKIYGELFPVSIKYQITKVRFDNINAAHQAPSSVQYMFSLRDQYNRAVIFDTDNKSIYNLKIWENKEELDYLESNTFLSTQDDFQLQLMLVLDFSASMNEHANGVETMVKGATSLIDSLKETHEIGVIEFHGPQSSPKILQQFITNKEVAINSIKDFTSNAIYSDFSICWDAVYKGLELFPTEPDPKVFRALVFLSDGFDNSSTHLPNDITSLANQRDIHIYNIGVGDVHEEQVLEKISKKTGGTYVHAQNMCILLERFQQIIRDLGGQYRITYVTPKKLKDNIFTVKCEATYNGIKSIPPLTREIDISSIYGDTQKGILTFTSTLNPYDKKAEIFLWSEHAPRYVNEFRFRLNGKHTVSVVSTDEGGLCGNWEIINENNGWYRLVSPDKKKPKKGLSFGSNGTVCKITINDISKSGTTIPFKLDNSVYTLGQSFFGGNDSEIDAEGNWNTNIIIGTHSNKQTQKNNNDVPVTSVAQEKSDEESLQVTSEKETTIEKDAPVTSPKEEKSDKNDMHITSPKEEKIEGEEEEEKTSSDQI